MKWISITEQLPKEQDFIWDGLWTPSALCIVLKKDKSVALARYTKADGVFKSQWQEFGSWLRGAEYLRAEGRAIGKDEVREQEITHWYPVLEIKECSCT